MKTEHKRKGRESQGWDGLERAEFTQGNVNIKEKVVTMYIGVRVVHEKGKGKPGRF
jgi:hypothetical protein